MSNLTKIQTIVLSHMAGAMKPGGPMTVKDFDSVAMVNHHRPRWPSNLLHDMRCRGLVEMRLAAVGRSGHIGWRITMRGLEALLEKKTAMTAPAPALQA